MPASPVVRLSIALLGVASPGCAPAPEPPPSAASATSVPTDQPATRLLSSVISGYTESAEEVIRDPAAWASAWRRLHDANPATALPEVDFDRSMVVLLALGERSAGGHAVRFDELVRDGEGATVRYTVTSPGPTCMSTQAITSPVEVVRVARVAGTVRFERRMVQQPC